MILRPYLAVWALLACLRLGECDSIHHVNRWIAMATCQARCLTLYGERQKHKTGNEDTFRPYACTTDQCRQCSAPCDWKLLGEKRCENDCVDTKCGHSCLVLYRSLTNLRRTTLHGNGILGTEHLRDTEDGIHMGKPGVICKDTPRDSLPDGQYLSELYLRWTVAVTERSRNVAVVFVLALRRKKSDGRHTRWSIIAKTPYSIFHVKHLVAGAEYQLRVTPVSCAGYAGKDVISEWISTMPVGRVGDPPTSIHMVDQQLEHGDLITATFELTTANDQACYFKVIWSSDRNDGYEELFLTRPWTNTRLRIEGLHFSRKYTLIMRAFSPDFLQEGESIAVNFATASCLEVTGHDFEKCAPGLPLMSRYSHLKHGKEDASIRITWVPPRYTSTSNTVTGYIVDWKQIVTDALTTTHDAWTELPGNVNGLVLTSLHKDSVYEVQLRTKSNGGIGPPLFLIVRTDGLIDSRGRQHGDEPVKETISPAEKHVSATMHIPWEVYPLIPVCIALLILIILMCLRNARVRKARAFARRWTNIQELSQVYSSLSIHSGKCTTTDLISHDKYEIPWKCLLLKGMIHDGTLSVVKKADLSQNADAFHDGHTSKEVAVKILKGSTSEVGKSKFLREMDVLKRLGNHPNIVGIIGCCSTGPRTYLVLDLCPLGDLHSYLRRAYMKKFIRHTSDSSEDNEISSRRTTENDNEYVCTELMGGSIAERPLLSSEEDRLSEYLLMSYASQIATGMDYVSSCGVVHGDLATRNILLSDVRTVKISGFGMAFGLDQHTVCSRISGVCNAYKWLSPEVMGTEQRACTTKTDVWAFGVTLWELITLGASPYLGVISTDLHSMLKNGYRLNKPGACSESSYSLMLQCWHTEPESRPTFTEIRAEIDTVNSRHDSDNYLNNTSMSDISSAKDTDLNMSSNKLPHEEVSTNVSQHMLISPRAASLGHYAPAMTAILEMEDWSSDDVTYQPEI